METPTETNERHYEPSPRIRAFRMIFGLLLLTALIAVGVQP